MQRPAGVVHAEVCVPSGLLPSDLCGRTTSDLFVKEKLPTEHDNWWQEITIDTRTGKPAPPSTPSRYRRTRVALVPPEEWLGSEVDKKAAEEWARALNITLLGEGREDEGLSEHETFTTSVVAFITLPQEGQQVRGITQILGGAGSSDFVRYSLQWGQGRDPLNWTTFITRPSIQETGTLGVWDTTGLTNGEYTLRLIVETSQDQTVASVSVNVTN
jgi:hypothetical protein